MVEFSVRRIAAAIALSATPVVAQQMQVAPPPVPQIITNAQGEAIVTPDRATINFAVETRAPTAAVAGADNAHRLRAVMDTLRKLGIPAEMIRTGGYNVFPEQVYEANKPPRISGYVAHNTIRVDVRNLELVGKLIDGALASGSNSVGSLSFMSSRIDEVRRQALTDAVSRARLDAEAMARAAGGGIGQLIELSASYDNPRPIPYGPQMMQARAKVADVETPISPGEQTVTASVSARWSFVSNH